MINNTISESEIMDRKIRIGNGFDVHRFIDNRPLILGGVSIAYKQGLDGHSDADVLIHSIMDAILGGASLGDIGHHFPNTDPVYAGISSLVLLKRVNKLVNEKGYVTGNIDTVILAEKPIVAPYIRNMKKNISEVLNISEDNVNIKATTMEKLGFIGREEGIGAMSVALLYKTE